MHNYGWDVVFACSGNYINRQLAKNTGSQIESFSYEDESIEVSGDFGAWQLTPGGSSQLLHLKTPIIKGHCIIKSNKKTYSLDGAVPLLQLQLSFMDGAVAGSKDLRFNCSVVGQKPNDTTPGAVTVLDPDTTGALAKEDPDRLADALLKTALAKALIANQGKLAFVFASVFMTAPKNAGWLTLKEIVYAYQQDMDKELGSFAILGMLTTTDISSHSHVYDPSLLRPSDDFGFMLSGQQFMKNLLLPKMPKAYKGSKASEFRLSGNTIVNHGKVHLKEVEYGAIWYSPYITHLDIHINESSIRTIVAGRCAITGLTGAYVTFSVTSNNAAKFNPSGPFLTFEKDRHKHVTHSKYIPGWEEWLGVLTLGILNGVAAIVGNGVEDSVSSAVSETGVSASSMGAAMVTWPGQETVKFEDGGLLDNFYMRGKASSS
ncbi:MAG: hypothetical protein NPIRA02_08820 [Nitrospirales bacterium]|nr:MAG: hypothetical protein NPIRA02_08820 [Nitrospirales bacterium]